MSSSSSDRPSLPNDLVEEILCRIPTESLTRFKLTCKRWLALFRDKRFIYKHLALVQQQFIRIYNIVQIINHEKKPSIFIPLPLDFQGGFYISVRAHCDGLLLCLFDWGILAIWNPYLKQVKWIYSFSSNSSLYYYGIGYKSVSRDDGYKILRFYDVLHVDEGRNNWPYNTDAEIFDFEYNSWRSLDSSIDWYVCKPHRAVSLNGNMYWIAKRSHSSEVFIQSFDFSVEKFEPLCSLPSACGVSSFKAMSDFRGDALSLLQEREETIDIWVTSKIKNGVVISWTKIFSVPRPNLPVLYAFSDRVLGRPVYFIDKNNRIIVCCEELSEDGSYVCVNVHVIGEDGFEEPIEVRKHQSRGVNCPFISGFAHLPSLVPVPK